MPLVLSSLRRLLTGFVLVAMISLGMAGASVASPAPSLSLCLNKSADFVLCDQLPAGSGTLKPAGVASSHGNGHTGLRSGPEQPTTPTGGSLLDSSGAKAAAGIVGFGIALGFVSFAFGWRRHKKGPRWEDRTDYRAA
jgi:hypothetical protein